MITLTNALRVGACTVFRDVAHLNGARSYTKTFFVIADAPRLARDERGGPAFDFLCYRGAPGETADHAGGFVTLTTEWGPAPEDRAALIDGIRRALPSETLDAIAIVSVPFTSGTVALAVAGEDGSGPSDLARQVAGSGPARLIGSERATFGVDLTADGAALLLSALDSGLAMIKVHYDFVFDGRLDDTELHVWCDARRAYEVAARALAGGPSPARTIVDGLIAQRVAGVDVQSPSPLAAVQREALERLGQQLLTSALSSTLFDMTAPAGSGRDAGATGSVAGLHPVNAASDATLNHTFTESFPVEQHATGDALLTVGSKAALGDRVRIVDADAGFFRVLEVKVYCTVRFDQSPVVAVIVRLAYDAMGPSGRVASSTDFVFQDGSPAVQTFRTITAAPDARSYRYTAEARVHGAPPVTYDYGETDATAIVVDDAMTGVLRVSIALGDAPSDRVQSAIVDVEHPPTGAAARFVLDGASPTTEWYAAVGTAPATPYRYRVAWAATDGRRVEGDWQPSTARSLLLSAPADLLRRGEVLLLSAGDFAGIAQIVVGLRAAAAADATEFTFTAGGVAQKWRSPLLDPSALRYQARQTFVYATGQRRSLDWTDLDRPVFIVSDALRVDVQIVPRLLDFASRFNFAVIALAYEYAAANIHEQGSIVIRDGAEVRWSFHTASPARPTFQYELTLFPKQGPRIVLPRQESSDQVLVLRPPA